MKHIFLEKIILDLPYEVYLISSIAISMDVNT